MAPRSLVFRWLPSAGLAALLACGGPATPTPEIPPIDDESMVGEGGETDGGGEVSLELPTEGGPRVRLGRVRVPAGEALTLPGAACLEAIVFVEEGNVRTPADEDLPGGTLYRTQRETALLATEDATAIVTLVRPASMESESEPESPVCEERVMGDVVVDIGSVEPLPNAGGKLLVRILIDAEGGATFGAFSLLEAEADLDVPVHTHADEAEVLLIDSGDGTMILGDERFQLAPGRVVYVPAGVEHGYEGGSQPLRAYQVYDPPGPEQRFRGTPAQPSEGSEEETP